MTSCNDGHERVVHLTHIFDVIAVTHVLKRFFQISVIFAPPHFAQMICLFDVGSFNAVVRHKSFCSGPIKAPSLLALRALHLIIGDPLAAGDLPSVQDLELANREVFSGVVALLLTADRDPNVVVLQIPHADLYLDSVAADNFEEFPVVLVAVFPIKVDHGISGAKCKYLILFIKSDAEDISRARVGQRYLILYPGGLTGLVGDAGDSLVRHGCYQLD